jgi:hypothetical protein
MKRRVFLLIVAGIFLLAGCKCGLDKPKNLQPVDRYNYNSVNTVFWYYYNECRDFKSGDTVLVSGWTKKSSFHIDNRYGDLLEIELFNNLEQTTDDKMLYITFYGMDSVPASNLQLMLDTADLSKKCYIKGVVTMFDIRTMYCCTALPGIRVSSDSDIFLK